MHAPDFWDRKTQGLWPSILRPVGCCVAAISHMRQKSAAPWRASVPVICIGNLVAGGAGKTPVAIDTLARLQTLGLTPHAVSRGYGGAQPGPLRVDPATHTSFDVGDEPLLLARTTPTWVSHDRRKGIEAAIQAGADIVVMDDGFQNPGIEKDLSLLVVDGGYGFGNGRVMPAGPLRETIKDGLARADAVVLLGTDNADVWGRVRRAGYKDLAVIRAALEPVGKFADLKGQKVFAFAGIGRPEKFFQTLKELGCTLAGCRAFDDHHPYREAEILTILANAIDCPVLTTAKDHVRLSPAYQNRVRVLEIALAWKQTDQIDALLAPFAPPQKTPADDN